MTEDSLMPMQAFTFPHTKGLKDIWVSGGDNSLKAV